MTATAGFEEWMSDASCAHTDPELFFPKPGGSVKTPMRICAACPVRTQCLEYAVRTGQEHGIWGGTSPEQRRHMRTHGRAA